MTDKYVPSGTPLTDYEREVLTILAEEAAEVAQAACKLLRFGKENRPLTKSDHPDAGVPNTVVLSREVGDLTAVAVLAMEIGLVSEEVIDAQIDIKAQRLARYMQTTR